MGVAVGVGLTVGVGVVVGVGVGVVVGVGADVGRGDGGLAGVLGTGLPAVLTVLTGDFFGRATGCNGLHATSEAMTAKATPATVRLPVRLLVICPTSEIAEAGL